jgi:hypothetical protein
MKMAQNKFYFWITVRAGVAGQSIISDAVAIADGLKPVRKSFA